MAATAWPAWWTTPALDARVQKDKELCCAKESGCACEFTAPHSAWCAADAVSWTSRALWLFRWWVLYPCPDCVRAASCRRGALSSSMFARSLNLGKRALQKLGRVLHAQTPSVRYFGCRGCMCSWRSTLGALMGLSKRDLQPGMCTWHPGPPASQRLLHLTGCAWWAQLNRTAAGMRASRRHILCHAAMRL